jgi:hypothetical protein
MQNARIWKGIAGKQRDASLITRGVEKLYINFRLVKKINPFMRILTAEIYDTEKTN